MISHTTWEGDEATLIKIHRQLIRAKIEYGASIYQSAKPNHLKIVDTSINSSIRLALGALRSSPIESIRNLAFEPPPDLRRIEKSLLYAANIARNPGNPANKHTKNSSSYAKEYKVDLSSIIKVQPYTFPSWNTSFNINLELTKFKKETTLPITYKNHLHEIIQNHKNDKLYFTDASKSEEGMGIAIIRVNLTSIFKLPECCSIYTAEAIAILKTVELIIEQGNSRKNNLILLDSLSTLQSLKITKNTTDIAKNIQ